MDLQRVQQLAGLEVLAEGAVGPFWPNAAKLKKANEALDFPAAKLMKPEVWKVIVAAIADKCTVKELDALKEEIEKRIKG